MYVTDKYKGYNNMNTVVTDISLLDGCLVALQTRAGALHVKSAAACSRKFQLLY